MVVLICRSNLIHQTFENICIRFVKCVLLTFRLFTHCFYNVLTTSVQLRNSESLCKGIGLIDSKFLFLPSLHYFVFFALLIKTIPSGADKISANQIKNKNQRKLQQNATM